MKSTYLIAPIATAIALAFGTVSAQTSPATGTAGSGGVTAPSAAGGSGSQAKKDATKEDKLARGDRKFIEEAAGHGMFEVQVGQLAASKATDPQVKSFAERLVKDHTAANQELQQIASKHQVEIPKELPRSQRNKLQDLQKKSGAEFDREFVKEVGLEAHEEDIKKFEKASKDVKTPELKAWVDKTLPKLKEHHAAAQKLPQAGEDASRMGAGGSGGASKSNAPAGGGANRSSSGG